MAIPLLIVYSFTYLTSILIITDNKIIGQTGILKTHNVNTLLEDVTNIVIEKDFLGRILGYGDIIISVYGDKIIFRDISNPERFRNEYYNLIE